MSELIGWIILYLLIAYFASLAYVYAATGKNGEMEHTDRALLPWVSIFWPLTVIFVAIAAVVDVGKPLWRWVGRTFTATREILAMPYAEMQEAAAEREREDERRREKAQYSVRGPIIDRHPPTPPSVDRYFG